jgi:hypothetical protein
LLVQREVTKRKQLKASIPRKELHKDLQRDAASIITRSFQIGMPHRAQNESPSNTEMGFEDRTFVPSQTFVKLLLGRDPALNVFLGHFFARAKKLPARRMRAEM